MPLVQELFLGQILFMSQDLTDAGVVDMCNSFMESSSSIKMSVLGHDIQVGSTGSTLYHMWVDTPAHHRIQLHWGGAQWHELYVTCI